jgi:hypothetical protein
LKERKKERTEGELKLFVFFSFFLSSPATLTSTRRRQLLPLPPVHVTGIPKRTGPSFRVGNGKGVRVINRTHGNERTPHPSILDVAFEELRPLLGIQPGNADGAIEVLWVQGFPVIFPVETNIRLLTGGTAIRHHFNRGHDRDRKVEVKEKKEGVKQECAFFIFRTGRHASKAKQNKNFFNGKDTSWPSGERPCLFPRS